MLIFGNILFSFGYKNTGDFITTLYLRSMMKTILLVSFGLGSCSLFLEKYLGLEPIAYLVIIILFILEFLTGVSASVFIKKERFNSWKMGRMVLKIFVYSIILLVFHVLSQKVGGFSIGNAFDFNFFKWTYFIILNLLILQLLISVLENLEVLGFKEVAIFLRIFTKKKEQIEEKINKK